MAKSFAEILKEAREKAGLNQMELAQRVGLTGSYISILEAGKKPPPTDKVLKKIAQILGLDTAYLLGVAHLERTPPDIKETVARLIAKPGLKKTVGNHLQELLMPPGTVSGITGSSKGIFKKALRYRLAHPQTTSAMIPSPRLPVFNEIPDISHTKISGKPITWYTVPMTEWKPLRYGFVIKKDEGMRPKIEQDDLLIIDAAMTPKNGDFVLVELEQQVLVRRFYPLSRDTFELLPFNPDLPPLRFSQDKQGIMKGVVIKIIRTLK